MSIRVLIADDHQAVRAGLTSLMVGTEFEVAAQAVDCDETVRFTLTCAPEVVVLDMRMRGGSGVDVVTKIKLERPETRVVLFTAADSIPAMIEAFNAGADGYVNKGVARDVLLQTMRRVAAGKSGWNRRQLRQIGTAKRCRYEIIGGIGLTERESQVLKRIVAGHSNEEIAEDLNVDLETIKQHVKHILARLGVEDRTQAALWAVRNGVPTGSCKPDTIHYGPPPGE